MFKDIVTLGRLNVNKFKQAEHKIELNEDELFKIDPFVLEKAFAATEPGDYFAFNITASFITSGRCMVTFVRTESHLIGFHEGLVIIKQPAICNIFFEGMNGGQSIPESAWENIFKLIGPDNFFMYPNEYCKFISPQFFATIYVNIRVDKHYLTGSYYGLIPNANIYKTLWDRVGIPFNRAVLLYITRSVVWNDRIKVDPDEEAIRPTFEEEGRQWVIENYEKYKAVIEDCEKYIFSKVLD